MNRAASLDCGKPRCRRFESDLRNCQLDARATVHCFQGVTSQPVTQRHHGYSLDITNIHLDTTFECRQSLRRTSNGQLAAMAVDSKRDAYFSNSQKEISIDLNAADDGSGARDSPAQQTLRARLFFVKCCRI